MLSKTKKNKSKLSRGINNIKLIVIVIVIVMLLIISFLNPNFLFDKLWDLALYIMNIVSCMWNFNSFSLFLAISLIGSCICLFFALKYLWWDEIIAFKCEDTRQPNTYANGTLKNLLIKPEDIEYKKNNVTYEDGAFVKMPLSQFSGREILRDTKKEITLTILGKTWTWEKPIFENKQRGRDFKSNQDLINEEINRFQSITYNEVQQQKQNENVQNAIENFSNIYIEEVDNEENKNETL